MFIGTRCGLHARYAALVMERGLPLFLEKPVCIDEAQYARLLAAPPAQRGRVWSLSRCTSPASYRR